RVRTMRWPGNVRVASRYPKGNPMSTLMTAEVTEVTSDSCIASRDSSAKITSPRSATSMRESIPSTGTSRKTIPAIAGTHSHPGIAVCSRPVRVPGISGGGEAGVAQQLLSRVGTEELDEGLGLLPVLTVGNGRGRVVVDDLVRACAGDVGDVDDARIGLPGADLAEDIGHRVLLADRVEVDIVETGPSVGGRSAGNLRCADDEVVAGEVPRARDRFRIALRHRQSQGVRGEHRRLSSEQVVSVEGVHGLFVGGGDDVRGSALGDLGDQIRGTGEGELHGRGTGFGAFELIGDVFEHLGQGGRGE